MSKNRAANNPIAVHCIAIKISHPKSNRVTNYCLADGYALLKTSPKGDVILRERSESKDLRTNLDCNVTASGKILRLRASPSAQDDTPFSLCVFTLCCIKPIT